MRTNSTLITLTFAIMLLFGIGMPTLAEAHHVDGRYYRQTRPIQLHAGHYRHHHRYGHAYRYGYRHPVRYGYRHHLPYRYDWVRYHHHIGYYWIPVYPYWRYFYQDLDDYDDD